MYGGEETVDVELLCKAHLMNAVVDHFGAKVPTKVIDDDHFVATVTVSPSPTFYRWVFGWDGDMKILGPQGVVDAYKEMLAKALHDY